MNEQMLPLSCHVGKHSSLLLRECPQPSEELVYVTMYSIMILKMVSNVYAGK